MRELISVALLGFALAASPGPVNALAFARGLRSGALGAVLLTMGAHTADVLYATLVILGAAPFVNRPAVQVVLSIRCVRSVMPGYGKVHRGRFGLPR